MTSVTDHELVQIDNKANKAILIGASCVIVIFTSPIAISDLVYGFSKDECLNEYPPNIDLNMKKYLIVSGFVSLFSIIYILFNLCVMLDTHEKKDSPLWLMVLTIMVGLFVQIFQIIWNIFGAIVFWNFIYPEGECKPTTSNYLFTSLIIKIVFNYISILNNMKNKNEE